jgi:uncharacterized protein (UPF0548 family)
MRSYRCYWSAVDWDGRATVVEVGYGVAAWKTAGSVVLHWSSLDGANCSVKPDEARELIWLVPTKVFAVLLLLLVTL